ncbi:MAG TPA: hypothetical protein ENN49_01110 [Bacteroidales bacterium]|nr:hypothetical protein [Bacteroidales bacterium]
MVSASSIIILFLISAVCSVTRLTVLLKGVIIKILPCSYGVLNSGSIFSFNPRANAIITGCFPFNR